MGRPPLEISADQVEKLANLGCTTEEIADFFGCSTDTIQRRFAVELTRGKADVKLSLRRWQIRQAKNGNATMLVWLGKNLLGQKDTEADDVKKAIKKVGQATQEQLDEFRKKIGVKK